MKKITALFVLILTLSLSGMIVHAAEKDHMQVVSTYVNLFLNEVRGTKGEENFSDLKDSLEQIIKNVNPEDAKKIIDFANKKIKEGIWESDEAIKKAIAEGEKEFNVTLTKEQKELILTLIKKIKKLEISPEYFLQQLEEIYNKYGEDLKNSIEKEKKEVIEKAQNTIKTEVNKSITNYFSDMVTNVKSFFKGIFRK